MTHAITKEQIGLIHVLAQKAGMDDDTRRDYLQHETGQRSSKNLSRAEAATVIDDLRRRAGDGAVKGLDGAWGKKLRALWIAGYNLGLVRNRDDRAMLSFLERQTGVSHVRFLVEPGQANAAIEALKAWLARDGGVVWPTERNADVLARKRAVLVAQWGKLVAIGAVKPFIASEPLGDLDHYAFKVAGKNGWTFFESRDYDAVQTALGKKVRAALARKAAA